ncbi:uncharacterized protein L203_105642 [Cryptococcus depauperatus CBS 7841]|uniref:non-specific serine/threonine protein kinase n=1 Tax=Cryptococcus depauperatus CBS 7841 TaxID=1295531 RepID=A0A1E3IH33_9TREE|nr:CAMK/CAMKL/KIN4 protein kinase [Cryptococcus depauperatus CBS 7841]
MATSSITSTHPNASIHQQRPPAHHSFSYSSYPYSSVPATSMAQPHAYYNHPSPSDFGPQVQAGVQFHTQQAQSHHVASGTHASSDMGNSTLARPRPPASSTAMPIVPTVLPDPNASASQGYPSNTNVPQQARAANRRSHNPAATLNLPQAPRPEELTDEYVLHPSVYAFKQEYPRRAMVGLGPYIVLQTLGEGEFGKVKLGVHADYGVEVAIKLIRRGDLQEEAHASKVEREINVLKTLKHPNIVRMFDVLDTHKYIGIVLEFAGGGELFEYILANEYLKDKEGQRLFSQLIYGVDYLHKKGVIHRDLKLENLLLDKNRNLIITDFGFANQFDLVKGDLMSTSCGSPCYAAPELVVLDTPYSGSAVDIWSCGVILFAMLAGYLPYDDDPDNPDAGNVVELYRYIMNTELNYPDHVSSLGKNLLQHMLILHPEHRIKIPQIVQHPWLKPYRHMFNKSVEECEAAFQETMYKKSKQARKELQERRRVQTQAKEAMQAREKAFAQRSQSSAPGTTITASSLDQNRRRPHSALPGAMTMPEIIAKHSAPVDDGQLLIQSTAPTWIRGPVPADSVNPQSTQVDSARRRSESMAPGLASTAPPVLATVTAAAQPVGIGAPSFGSSLPAVATALVQHDDEMQSSIRDSKNRHTIQVEYDGEASYETMSEVLTNKDGRVEGSMETTGTAESGMLAPPLPNVKQGDSSDVEMESGSSDNDHLKASEMGERQQKRPSSGSLPIAPTSIPLAPPAESAPVVEPLAMDVSTNKESISSPSEQKANPLGDGPGPSTPRASMSIEEAVNATPRAKAQTSAVAATPKASSGDRRRHGSMPPALNGPSATNSRPSGALNSAGLPKPPKKDRYRKGMSLDKFGLAKLLGHASQAPSTVHGEGRMVPPSASASAVALQNQLQEKAHQEKPWTEANSIKKTRRRTLQLGFHSRRESKSPASIPVPGTPLTDKDTNGENKMRPSPSAMDSLKSTRRKTIQLGFNRQPTRENKTVSSVKPVSNQTDNTVPPPQPASQVLAKPELNAAVFTAPQSSPSIVTVDAFTAQQANYSTQRSSSSKAARVMDWFRRKTLAKETLGDLKSSGLKSDSQSSFVQVGDEAHSLQQRKENSGNLAMASYDSINKIGELGHSGETKERSSETSGADPDAQPKPVEVVSTTPAVTITPPRPTVASTPTMESTAHSPFTTRTRSVSSYNFDESKIRIHTGLVDQSALSTKAPQDVFKEVMQVLRGMGVDMKRESDFKLRCTRAKKGRVASTGLGLGSVMSTGSGMNPFSLMNNASTSRTDARGLPMPNSPSISKGSAAGIKGLLRRGSSRSSAHPARFASATAENATSPSQSTLNLEMPETTGSAKPQPLYGKELMDAGDEVKFTVELCKMKNLPGLYILKIKRTKGNLWSFKFIYQTVIERTTTLTH